MFQPIAIPEPGDYGTLLPQTDRWIRSFIVLGIVARAVRYFVRFPLWEDECFVCVSFFKRGYLDLLKPLEYHQVGPYLWLWLEKTAVNLFGFNELSLRFFAFVSSLLGLWLFCRLTSRSIAGLARLLSIAFFAVGYPCLRYAAEAKLYPFDLFTSLVMLVLWVEWLRRPDQRKWLIALVIWCPLAVGLSFAAIFTACGISVLFLWLKLRHRLEASWTSWVVYDIAVVVGAGLVYLLTVRGQMGAELGYQGRAYAGAFPPLTSVGAFVKWMVLAHTGSLLAHPVGGENAGSVLTTILVGIGIVVLVRRRQGMVPMLMLAPLAFHFITALMRRYPYAGHVKFSMYIAPMIYTLFGVGCAALLGPDVKKGRIAAFARNVKIVLVLAAAIGLASVARDLLHPYKTTSDIRARAFARWFWHSARFEDQAVDIKDDLHREFSEGTWCDLSWSAMYLANKYIYCPQRIVTEPRPKGIPRPSERVLRCVLYRDPTKDFDQAAFDRWLAEMKVEHPYLGRDVYPFPRMDKRDRRLVTIDYVEVYKFRLSGDSATPMP